MPRSARIMSRTGYMHVIERGIGKQVLFESADDFKFYLDRLKKYCLETGVKVCCYCLMNNHVHLLLHGNLNSLSLTMKKIGVSYSWYYNKKYSHVGHLFQDRYISEPVENEVYFLTVFRYILQNPQKAGICRTSKYSWSSYNIYDNVPEYMDLSVIKSFFQSKQQYASYVLKDNDDQCMEPVFTVHNDGWAQDVIMSTLGVTTGTDLQKLGKKERDVALWKLKAEGLSIRQIERLTGIGRNIVLKARGNF